MIYYKNKYEYYAFSIRTPTNTYMYNNIHLINQFRYYKRMPCTSVSLFPGGN